MKKLFILTIGLLISNVFFAQSEITEGKITSIQKLTTKDPQVQAQLDMMGDMYTETLFKGENSFTQLDNPASGKVTTIVNTDKKEMLLLMDNPAMGKVYSKTSLDLNEEELKNIKVTEGDEVKTFLNYKCKQYFIEINKDGATSKVMMFATDALKIKSQQTTMFSDKISGFPLYIEMSMNQMGMEMVVITEVTKIEKQEVSEELFNTAPPEGYKSMAPGTN